MELYIPIWFYSNDGVSVPAGFVENLYIPIWFYSNFSLLTLLHFPLTLYIPIWFYSNVNRFKIERVEGEALHSNLVLF